MNARPAALARALRRAIMTACNDDHSDIGSERRERHLRRLDAMTEAAAFLEALAAEKGWQS